MESMLSQCNSDLNDQYRSDRLQKSDKNTGHTCGVRKSEAVINRQREICQNVPGLYFKNFHETFHTYLNLQFAAPPCEDVTCLA